MKIKVGSEYDHEGHPVKIVRITGNYVTYETRFGYFGHCDIDDLTELPHKRKTNESRRTSETRS